jgi:DNA-binding XRE family transcriptional regulator
MGKSRKNGEPSTPLSNNSGVKGRNGHSSKNSKRKGTAMTLAIANRNCKDAVGCIGERKSMEAMTEAVFTFAIKGAKRLLQLSAVDTDLLKRLVVEFASAPENKKPEIMETVLEVLFPDDHVGGVASHSAPDPEVRRKVDSSRLYIARQIRQRRDELGMTQATLARKAGIPQSHVSRLEVGKHVPTRITIERVADALAIQPSSLDPGYPDGREKEKR